jgi:DNA-binding NtrC family response regulator
MTLKQRMNEYERELILAALRSAGGNQRRAAAAMGILPSTLSEKLKRLGLRRAGEPSPVPELAGAGPSGLRA